MSGFFEQGLEFEKNGDYDSALKLYKLAADQGDSNAQWRLGAIYYTGKGVPKNETEGLQWVKLAANNGKAEAQFFFASCLLQGKGVAKNTGEAVKWCELAANQGYDKATQCLDEIKYAYVCEKIGYGSICSSNDINVLETMAIRGTLGAEGLLANARLNRARSLAKAGELPLMLESVSYYEALIQSNPQYKFIVGQELAEIYYNIAKVFDANGTSPIDYYIKADEYGYTKAKFDIAMAYYNEESIVKDYSKAIYYFKKCTELGIEEGKSHYYLGNCFYWGLGVPVDFEIAKKHYINAYEYGFNCSYSIEVTKVKTGETYKSYSMKEYAEAIKKRNLSEEKRSQQIIDDLSKDFGCTWNMLQKASRKALATAMDTYVYIYSKGPHIYGNYDFSASIAEMCKALEIELVYYLYSGYIKYLEDKNVSPDSFEGKRTFLKKISATNYAYAKPDDISNVTLGAIDVTIGAGKKGSSLVDESMIEYLDFIFKDDAFTTENRRQEISKYILDLSNTVFDIKENYRNHAIHSRSMKCDMAEICGDRIIKVQKLLFGFLSKLK